MDEQKLKYIIEIAKQGSAASAVQELKGVEDQAGKANTGLLNLATTMRTAVAGIAASAVVTAAYKTVAAFQEQQREIARLEGALRAAGRFTEEYSTHLQGLADEYEKLYGVQGEQIMRSQALLVSFQATSGEVERLTQLSLDLSAGMGRDLGTSTQLLTQALNGNFEMFKRMGVTIDDNATRAEKFQSVIGQLEKRFGGLAGSVGSSQGGFDRLRTTFDDLSKNIGQILSNVVNPLLETTNSLLGDVAETMTLFNSGRIFEVFSTQAFNNARLVEQLQEQARKRRQGAEAVDPNTLLDPKTVERERAQLARSLEMAMSSNALSSSFYINEKGVPDYQSRSMNGVSKVFDFGENQGMGAIKPTSLVTMQMAFDKQKELLDQQKEQGIISLADADAYMAELTHTYGTGYGQIAQTGLQALDEVALASMSSREREVAMVSRHFDQQKGLIDAYYDYEIMLAGENAEEIDRLLEERKAAMEALGILMKRELSEMDQITKEVGLAFANGFAGGISNAFMEIIKGTKDAKAAFQDFASSLLSSVAQMIMELLIMAAIKSALDGTKLGGLLFSGGGSVVKAASGMSGVAELNSPTYLPSWNVMAAEAGGSEMMTVLSSPKTWSIGGAAVISGNVGPSRLAMMAEQDFRNLVPAANGMVAGESSRGGSMGSGTGAGGVVEVRVRLDENLRGEIVDQSIEGAVVRVNNELSQDSQTSRAVKDLTS